MTSMRPGTLQATAPDSPAPARRRRARAAALGAVACAASPPASAHAGSGLPGWTLAWSWEPWVIGCLALSAAGYAIGLRRLWRHARPGRGIRGRQVAAFAAGWLALAAALVSPLDRLGVQLFSAHMLQHELMMIVAAPLLCLAQPLVAWTWALPAAGRAAVAAVVRHPAWRRAWRALSAPLAAWMLHAVALWGWHLPALFDRALNDAAVHTAQHVSFLASALLFWWAVLRPDRRAAAGGAIVYVFTTMVHTAFLGALLTVSERLWYPSYQASASMLGLDPVEDQQLGGLVMWVPAGSAYLVLGLWLAGRWLNGGAPRARRAG